MPKGVYPHKKRPLASRFWEKVAFLGTGSDDCWEWRGAKNSRGYGVIGVAGKNVLAHRVSWELANGPIPEGLCVLHHCDNPSCMNPAHLFLGTNADNSNDMVAKGRQARGEEIRNGKFMEKDIYQVRDLLEKGWLQREVAGLFNVSRAAISHIATGAAWEWL